MKPTVTIAVPVYNGAKYIREALDSALAQRFTDFELLISDNASNDETQLICEAYSKLDQRVKYVRQENNIGAVKNFTYLAESAQGIYFTWLAHDDTLFPDYLEKTVGHLQLHPRTVVVSGGFEYTNELGDRIRIEQLSDLRPSLKWQTRCARFFEYPAGWAHLSIYGLMRTDVCREIMQTFPFEESVEWDVRAMCRFTLHGELDSLPLVLRRIRVSQDCDSISDSIRLSKLPLLKRISERVSRRNRTRRYQLGVLLSSTFPISLKLWILSAVLVSYGRFFFQEQRALPRRAFLVLSGKR